MNSKYPANPVLLVDDEEQFLQSGSFSLRTSGISNVEKCNDSRNVLSLLREKSYSVIILDLMMPYLNGDELLPEIVQEFPEIPVIMHTAVNEVSKAVGCMKKGAFDYLTKPVDKARLVTCVKKAIQFSDLKTENIELKKSLLRDRLEKPVVFENIVTGNHAMYAIFHYIEAIASTSLPVLITGDTGVGKEMIAKAVHDASRRKGEFVSINVAGLDDSLFSDTLFGHVKGAFTGAEKMRKGLIEKAAGGTLFLDEIGDLKIESQIKLLRLLEERTYYQVGSDHLITSDARIVVATNVDLNKMQNDGIFRKDLFYRLQNHHIEIPSLYSRKDDIPLLTDFFMETAAREVNKAAPTFPPELYTLLANYHFPGNIRELKGMIFDAVSRHKSGILSMNVFKERISKNNSTSDHLDISNDSNDRVFFSDPLPSLKEVEKKLVAEALKRSNNNQTIAAQMLGLTRSALNKRLNRPEK
ncbi:sigma-54-dependent transcriptional regulator [Candidatus Cloacimonadota bacterium]